jgi:hypothetical protein
MKFHIRWLSGKFVAVEIEFDSTKVDLGVLTKTEREQLIESLTDAIDSLSHD